MILGAWRDIIGSDCAYETWHSHKEITHQPKEFYIPLGVIWQLLLAITKKGWRLSLDYQCFPTSTVKYLISEAQIPKTYTFLVLSCSSLWSVYWSQVLSRKLRCSWAVPTGNARLNLSDQRFKCPLRCVSYYRFVGIMKIINPQALQ